MLPIMFETNLTSSIGIPSVFATVVENVSYFDPGFSRWEIGIGTHPDAGTAVMRALAEAAQSRAVAIQGMREDMAMPHEGVERWREHAQISNVDPDSWPHRPSTRKIGFNDLPTYRTDDIVADIGLMLDRLRTQGIERAIVVDLSPPGIPVNVVRVIIPGIESWGIDKNKLGPRATMLLDKAEQALIAQHTPVSASA